MEENILEILENIIKSISDDIIPKSEREKISFNINKKGSVSFNVFKNILLKITFKKTKIFIELRKIESINLEELLKKFDEVKYKENDLYVWYYNKNKN